MKWKKWEVIFEFLIFGIVIGIVEDVIAVKLATGASLNWDILVIIVLIAIPFAFLGEVVADNIDFSKILKRIFEKKDENEI